MYKSFSFFLLLQIYKKVFNLKNLFLNKIRTCVYLKSTETLVSVLFNFNLDFY